MSNLANKNLPSFREKTKPPTANQRRRLMGSRLLLSASVTLALLIAVTAAALAAKNYNSSISTPSRATAANNGPEEPGRVKELNRLAPKLFRQGSGNTSQQELGDELRQQRQTLQEQLEKRRLELQREIEARRNALRETIKNALGDMQTAAPEERGRLMDELRVNRQALREDAQKMRQNLREAARERRANFREKVRTAIGREDPARVARVALAHGRGLRMINRFRAAAARFDNILKRLESRTQKLAERGLDTAPVIPLLEEAKTTSAENEAKLEELKAKYESLLDGEKPRSVAGEARQIAKELKAATLKLHDQLRQIVLKMKELIPPQDFGIKQQGVN